MSEKPPEPRLAFGPVGAPIDADNQTPNFLDTSHLTTRLREHATYGGLATLSGQGAQLVLQILATVVLARLLTPQDYGLIGMVTVVTGFVGLFKDMGLSHATVQRDQITQSDASALFWMNIALSMALVVIVIVLAPAIAWFYSEPRLHSVAIVLSIGFLFGGLSAQHTALVRRQMRFGLLITVQLTSFVVAVAAAIAAAAAGWGYWALVVQSLAGQAVGAAMLWLIFRWLPGKPIFSASVRSMAAFGANLITFDFFNYFARNADNFLIGWRWGAASLGLYSKAYALLMLPLMQINAPVSAVAIPLLSRLQNQPERYRRAYRTIIDSVLLLTMPGITCLVMTSDWIVQVLLGPQWAPVSGIFTWLGVCALLQPLANSTGWLFISQGRARELARWGMIGPSLITMSFVAGLPWGPTGVACSYSLTCLTLIYPLLFYLIGRNGPVSTADLYQALVPSILPLLFVVLSLGALRLTGPQDAHRALALALPVAAFVALGGYTITASGRRILSVALATVSRDRVKLGT